MAVELEECDDGNVDDGDGCTSLCDLETGYMCSRRSCTKSVCNWLTGNEKCGDGHVLGAEAGLPGFCDDGDTAAGDGCSEQCQVECGYDCKGGGSTGADLCTTSCGDGLWVASDEECDDGNTADGDGCTVMCIVESGFMCSATSCQKSTCTEVCGDGVLTVSEQCDDGSDEDGDGCSALCS